MQLVPLSDIIIGWIGFVAVTLALWYWNYRRAKRSGTL